MNHTILIITRICILLLLPAFAGNAKTPENRGAIIVAVTPFMIRACDPIRTHGLLSDALFRMLVNDIPQSLGLCSIEQNTVLSGKAICDIDIVGKRAVIDKNGLYCFGHSAGAQFAHRFAFRYPEQCRAAAFHAPERITLPSEKVDIKFLLTVGREDPDRAVKAKSFVEACRALGISIEFFEYPGIGHELCGDAVHQSMNFFKRVKDE